MITSIQLAAARRLMERVFRDHRQPAMRRLEAIEVDNILDQSQPLPSGGWDEVRRRIRVLKAATQHRSFKKGGRR